MIPARSELAVLVDLETAPEQVDAGRGDLLAHEYLHRAHPTVNA